MPTEAPTAPSGTRVAMHPVAARRVLRLALGVALALCVSQMLAWNLSFICPVLVIVLLSTPFPAPGLKQGIIFVIALVLPAVLSMGLIPFLTHARWVGILLMTLALFYSFYYTARGGKPVLGTFMTVGITVVVTIGSVNAPALTTIVEALAINACFGIIFVWIAHAILPDLPADPAVAKTPPPKPPKPDLGEATRDALRALLVVLPIAILFLFMSGSASYTVMMIKVASMGQQASADRSADMGRSLLESTVWGGIGAMIGWALMSIWPSIVPYTLLTALAGLLYGRRIFQGPGMHPKFSMWSYAFLTALIILAPALMDTPGGSGAAIWSRLWIFIMVAFYGTAAVAVFNAFWPARNATAAGQGL